MLIPGQSGVGGLSPGYHQWSPSHALLIGANCKIVTIVMIMVTIVMISVTIVIIMVTCLYNNNQETKLQCFLVALTWMSQLAWLVLGARCVAKAHFIIIWQKCHEMC